MTTHSALTGLGRGRCLIIGEVALSHDGSLGLAHAFIDAIANAGADAVKFQTHIAAAESTPAEPFRVKFSRQDASRYEYWRRMEFTEEQWRGLSEHCRDRDVLFMSSPFSIQAVALLERIGQPLWKIASGEVANVALLDRVLDTGAPVLLSSGMSPLAETDAAVARVKSRGVDVGVFQCTTAYPCPPEKIGLNLVPFYRERYGCWVGLSDHSATIYAGLAGAAIGLDLLEVHVALSREMFGPDVVASVTTQELRQLVDGIRFIERMRAHPVDKDVSASETAPLRRLFTRSLVFAQPLPAGTVLTRDHLAIKKPGTGLAPGRLDEVVGKRLARAVAVDQLVSLDDIEGLQ
ncbi:MAG TPA: N-acetylneuraminate synthase family protein [Vicinamibacterales bacterium]|jgi:N,N'-diacetyllegionaminate synthase|nr:N-acetylneuraminate synthase family protein [Vicinamibacterales bacterium]